MHWIRLNNWRWQEFEESWRRHCGRCSWECESGIEGVRFILPIDVNSYVENTRYSKLVEGYEQVKEIINWYHITRDNTTIALEAYTENFGVGGYTQPCQYITKKEDSYKLIDLYILEEDIPPECRSILCPEATDYMRVKGEIIYQEETPL